MTNFDGWKELNRHPHGTGAGLHAVMLLCVLGAFAAGCGASVKSVAQFGEATGTLAEGVEATTQGSATLCERKRVLALDEKIILGESSANDVLVKLRADDCKGFRDKSKSYAALAKQLGAFGLALKTLAEHGETDYTTQLSELSASAEQMGLDAKLQPRVDAAAGLVGKLLSWFSQGYASSKISQALTESEQDVSATLELLLAVLDVYETQLKGYAQIIEQVSKEPEFGTLRAGEAPTAADERKRAQAEVVKFHFKYAKEREELLTASRKSIVELKKLHVDLVAEAKRKADKFDAAELVKRARRLSVEVTEFKKLAEQTVH